MKKYKTGQRIFEKIGVHGAEKYATKDLFLGKCLTNIILFMSFVNIVDLISSKDIT